MGRHKKPIETIKISGLTQKSVQEFSPKSDPSEEDYLWEQYFKGSPSLIKFPTSHLKTQETTSNNEDTGTPVSTPVHLLGNNLLAPDSNKSAFDGRSKNEPNFTYLDATHTSSEAKIYSIMYRETVHKNTEPQHFGSSRIMKLTGIGSDKTVRKAIRSLIEKKSIVMVDPCPNNPLGPVYRAVAPKDILSDRKKSGINIHFQTKKIVAERGITAVPTGVDTGVASPVEITGVTPVETTPVTPVEITGVGHPTPYISKINYLNNDEFINSSSKLFIENEKNDDDFDIKKFTEFLYKKYTGNDWNREDDQFFDSENLTRHLPDTIEAGIIKGALRAKDGPKSLADLKGTIDEAEDDLPPGMLNYLRRAWQARPNGVLEQRTELTLPQDSLFDAQWLDKFISEFPAEEREAVIRKAEIFDAYMCEEGKNQDWIKNPTGYFVKFARGELNLKPIPKALTFHERLLRQAELHRADEAERGRERVEDDVRALIEGLSERKRRIFLRNAREIYEIPTGESDDDALERTLYKLVIEWEKGNNWHDFWLRLTSEEE